MSAAPSSSSSSSLPPAALPPLSARLLSASPHLVNAVYLAIAGRQPVGGLLLVLLLLVAALCGPRLRLGLVERALAAALWVGAILLWGRALPGVASPLPQPWVALAAFVILSVATRLVTRDAQWGALGTSGYGLIALCALGQDRGRLAYGAVVVLHLALLLATQRREEPDRPRRAAQPRDLRAAGWLLVLGSAALAVLFTLPLRPLSGWIQGRFEDAFLNAAVTRVGFNEHLRLGDLQRVLESSRPVLRLRGPRSDYLRGGVYNRYHHNLWSGARTRAATVKVAPLRGPLAADEVEAEVLSERLHAEPFFLPLGLRSLAAPTGQVQADPLGVVSQDSPVLRFRIAAPEALEDAGAQRVIPLAAPGPEDLQLPQDTHWGLRAVAADFVGDARPGDAALRLSRIEERLLRDYKYSLHFKRRPGKDPLMEFLLTDRRGHCEYFAAAMTLLARAAGVPARLVGGYRVAERNELGGYYLVREKNAHAWVEAYVPGRGWQTWDPTPGGGVPDNQPHATPLMSALGDYLGVLAQRAWAWLLSQSPLKLGVPLGSVVVLGLWLRWRGRRRADAGARRSLVAQAPPLPGFVQLEAALAARGVARAAHEPLEVYAARLVTGGADAALGEAARLLGRYAELRYGTTWAREEEAALDAELRALCARLATLR